MNKTAPTAKHQLIICYTGGLANLVLNLRVPFKRRAISWLHE